MTTPPLSEARERLGRIDALVKSGHSLDWTIIVVYRDEEDPDTAHAADLRTILAHLDAQSALLAEAEKALEQIASHSWDEISPEWFAPSPPSWAKDNFNDGAADQCGYCGAWCEVVRPGKTQCPCCSDGRDLARTALINLKQAREGT